MLYHCLTFNYFKINTPSPQRQPFTPLCRHSPLSHPNVLPAVYFGCPRNSSSCSYSTVWLVPWTSSKTYSVLRSCEWKLTMTITIVLPQQKLNCIIYPFYRERRIQINQCSNRLRLYCCSKTLPCFHWVSFLPFLSNITERAVFLNIQKLDSKVSTKWLKMINHNVSIKTAQR